MIKDGCTPHGFVLTTHGSIIFYLLFLGPISRFFDVEQDWQSSAPLHLL